MRFLCLLLVFLPAMLSAAPLPANWTVTTNYDEFREDRIIQIKLKAVKSSPAVKPSLVFVIHSKNHTEVGLDLRTNIGSSKEKCIFNIDGVYLTNEIYLSKQYTSYFAIDTYPFMIDFFRTASNYAICIPIDEGSDIVANFDMTGFNHIYSEFYTGMTNLWNKDKNVYRIGWRRD